MEDPFLMSGSDRVREWERDLQELREWKTSLRNQLRERLSPNQLHGDEVDAFGLFHRVHGDDVRMIERRDRLRFPFEARSPLLARSDSTGSTLRAMRRLSSVSSAR
jgi:hypothetical protein